MINGITLNGVTLTSISFQPSLATVREFKVDNSTFSAEYGHSSGAVRFDNAIDLARAGGLAPQTVDYGFDNGFLQSWNLNVQPKSSMIWP